MLLRTTQVNAHEHRDKLNRNGNIMGLFNKLMSKIFNAGSSAATQAPASAPPAGGVANPPAPVAGASTAGAQAQPPQNVDVSAVLNELASINAEKLDWKKSIVDLMKLVGMESSLSERKELAKELGYTGDMGDSASMNTWLHKQVLKKLSENGSKVPADLLD